MWQKDDLSAVLGNNLNKLNVQRKHSAVTKLIMS